MRPTARIRKTDGAAAAAGALAGALLGGGAALAQGLGGGGITTVLPVSPGLSAGPSPFVVDPGSAGVGAGQPTGVAPPDVRLRGFLDRPFAGPSLGGTDGQARRGFQFVPTLTTRVFATDNIRNSARNREADVRISIIPSGTVLAETARLSGRLTYAPAFSFDVAGTQPSRLDHRFFGGGTLLVIPERVFVEARAFGSVSPLNPQLTTPASESALARSDLAQNYGFTFSPYWIQPYGTFATSIAGYTFQYNKRDQQTQRLTPGGPVISTGEDLISHTGYAAVRSGADFGRIGWEARVRGTTFDGGGAVTDGAHRALALVELRYAVTRTIQVLGEGGYEDIKFGGTRPYEVSEAVYGAGVRLDPSPNTTITAIYRRRDGFDAPFVTARAALGPRTVFFGSYSDTVGTQLSRSGELLSQIVFDENGNPVDSRTGAPSPDVAGVGLGFAQAGLTRRKRTTASLTQFLRLNTVTLQYTRSDTSPLSANPGQLVLGQVSDSVSLLWNRPITPQLQAFASVTYGRFESSTPGFTGSGGGASRGDNYLLRVGAVRNFGERLVGTLQYQLNHRTSGAGRVGGLGQGDVTQNALIGTLTARF